VQTDPTATDAARFTAQDEALALRTAVKLCSVSSKSEAPPSATADGVLSGAPEMLQAGELQDE
jgi:hypothetical protein